MKSSLYIIVMQVMLLHISLSSQSWETLYLFDWRPKWPRSQIQLCNELTCWLKFQLQEKRQSKKTQLYSEHAVLTVSTFFHLFQSRLQLQKDYNLKIQVLELNSIKTGKLNTVSIPFVQLLLQTQNFSTIDNFITISLLTKS